MPYQDICTPLSPDEINALDTDLLAKYKSYRAYSAIRFDVLDLDNCVRPDRTALSILTLVSFSTKTGSKAYGYGWISGDDTGRKGLVACDTRYKSDIVPKLLSMACSACNFQDTGHTMERYIDMFCQAQYPGKKIVIVRSDFNGN